MSEDNDANYIRLPTAVFIAMFSASGLFGAGAYGVIGPRGDDKLQGVIEDLSEIRETARAGLALSTQNSRYINDNRQLIFDKTQGRYSINEASADWRKQDARDEQQERRLTHLEREMDRMDKHAPR